MYRCVVLTGIPYDNVIESNSKTYLRIPNLMVTPFQAADPWLCMILCCDKGKVSSAVIEFRSSPAVHVLFASQTARNLVGM